MICPVALQMEFCCVQALRQHECVGSGALNVCDRTDLWRPAERNTIDMCGTGVRSRGAWFRVSVSAFGEYSGRRREVYPCMRLLRNHDESGSTVVLTRRKVVVKRRESE